MVIKKVKNNKKSWSQTKNFENSSFNYRLLCTSALSGRLTHALLLLQGRKVMPASDTPAVKYRYFALAFDYDFLPFQCFPFNYSLQLFHYIISIRYKRTHLLSFVLFCLVLQMRHKKPYRTDPQSHHELLVRSEHKLILVASFPQFCLQDHQVFQNQKGKPFHIRGSGTRMLLLVTELQTVSLPSIRFLSFSNIWSLNPLFSDR